MNRYKKNIKINKTPIGDERRDYWMGEISKKGTYLPKGVMYEDMDKAFIDFVKNDLSLTIDGEKVPVIFLTIQRWGEFTKTWEHSDKFKNIQMPFITIVRRPNPQVGTNQAGLFNIPGKRSYTYVKVPTYRNKKLNVDVYKIPQPTSVDITYDVKLFTTRMRDLNRFNSEIQQIFNSKQYYIKVNGNPMPLILEDIGDESNVDDFENKRFYIQPCEIKLLGYILDESKFEIIPGLSRKIIMSEIIEEKSKPIIKTSVSSNDGIITYNVIFNPYSELSFSFTSEYNITITDITNIKNISNIIIKVNNNVLMNGLTLTSPIIVNAGDLVYIEVNKPINVVGKFVINGNII